jgi:hypothetical protein
VIILGKSEGNRSLGGHKPRWNNNIKMGISEIEWGNID